MTELPDETDRDHYFLATQRLQTEVTELRAKIQDHTGYCPNDDDANAYRLIQDHVVTPLIGQDWDDDASEESIVIAWAEHVAAFHPDNLCLGKGCTQQPGAEIAEMIKLKSWVDANLPYADMHEERSPVDVIIGVLDLLKDTMPAIGSMLATLARRAREVGVDVPEVKFVPYTGPRGAKEAGG